MSHDTLEKNRGCFSLKSINSLNLKRSPFFYFLEKYGKIEKQNLYKR